MTIKKNVDLSIEEIALQLNIDVTDLLNYLNNRNTSVIRSESKVVEILQAYLKDLKNSNKANNTKRRHQYFLKSFLDYLLSNYPDLKIHNLNEAIVFEFLSTRRGRNKVSLSIGSQNNYIGIIKALMTYAYLFNYSEKNYSDKFNLVKEALLPRYFSSKELTDILDESLKRVHGYKYHAIISVLLGTGCRISELVNLRVCDINFEKEYIYIKKSKNNKERYIPLYPEIKHIITDYLTYTGLTPINNKNSGYIFSKDAGCMREQQTSIRAIQSVCLNIFRKLNLNPKLTIHSFRHTFAVRALKAEMKIHNLSMILGHSNINTTYGYVQLFPSDLKNEILEKYPFPLEKLVNKVLSYEDSNEVSNE